MKKVLFLSVIALAILASGCKKNKSKALEYNDSNPINMVLRGYHQIEASSEYDITYKSLNETAVTVTKSGKLYGKNVGEAQVKIDNGYESRTIDVIVDLFTEPTFEFGCNTGRIKALYGEPIAAGYVDTILVYTYTTNNGYSYACGQMDFFFYNGSYFESDVYIRPNVEVLLNRYLNENFTAIDTLKVYNPYIEDSTDAAIFRNKLDNNVMCGKYAAQNEPYNEWLIFYFPVDNSEKSFANVLKRRPRSSKLRY